MIAEYGRKIAFRRVHEDIRGTRADLPYGQSHRELRIQNCEFRAVKVGRDAALRGLREGIVCEHRGIAGLGARRRDGQNYTDREARLHLSACPELPDIAAGGRHGMRDTLCRVDYGAAADCQDKVRPKSPRLLDHAARGRYQGVRHHTAARQYAKACRTQVFFYPREETALLCGVAAVDYKYPLAAVALYQLCRSRLFTAPEYDFRRRIINKLLHASPPLLGCCCSNLIFVGFRISAPPYPGIGSTGGHRFLSIPFSLYPDFFPALFRFAVDTPAPPGFGFDCFSFEDDGPVSLSRAVFRYDSTYAFKSFTKFFLPRFKSLPSPAKKSGS